MLNLNSHLKPDFSLDIASKNDQSANSYDCPPSASRLKLSSLFDAYYEANFLAYEVFQYLNAIECIFLKCVNRFLRDFLDEKPFQQLSEHEKDGGSGAFFKVFRMLDVYKQKQRFFSFFFRMIAEGIKERGRTCASCVNDVSLNGFRSQLLKCHNALGLLKLLVLTKKFLEKLKTLKRKFLFMASATPTQLTQLSQESQESQNQVTDPLEAALFCCQLKVEIKALDDSKRKIERSQDWRSVDNELVKIVEAQDHEPYLFFASVYLCSGLGLESMGTGAVISRPKSLCGLKHEKKAHKDETVIGAAYGPGVLSLAYCKNDIFFNGAGLDGIITKKISREYNGLVSARYSSDVAQGYTLIRYPLEALCEKTAINGCYEGRRTIHLCQ